MPWPFLLGFHFPEGNRAAQVTRHHDGADEIKQGVSDGKINEHVDPVVHGSDDDEQHRGLGAYDAHPQDPVESGRSYPYPVDHRIINTKRAPS